MKRGHFPHGYPRPNTIAIRYHSGTVIVSFRCKETEKIFRGYFSKKFPVEFQRLAARKLEMLAAAGELKSLRIPPSNRLEKLKGDRNGQHSIRTNVQWRICFIWKEGNAHEVEITDYH